MISEVVIVPNSRKRPERGTLNPPATRRLPRHGQSLGGGAVDRIRTLRVLLLVTFRPEFDAPWIGRPYVTALIVNRLPEHEAGVMIDRLVGNRLLSVSIRQDIIERSGNYPKELAPSTALGGY